VLDAALDPAPAHDPALDAAVAEARAEARAVAARLAAMEAEAEANATLFADRISGLEASLPRLPVLETGPRAHAGDEAPAAAGSPPVPDPATALAETLRSLPRVVSLHRT
jgi:hypothetical protein